MKLKRAIFVIGVGAAVGFGIVQRSKAAKERSMSVTKHGSTGDGALSRIEVEADGVDDDGNLVVDDLIAAVDSDGKIVASDETIAIITLEGDSVIDEKISVLGDDGELHLVDEVITVTEIDEE